MSAAVIKSTEDIVSCSDNGQHPLVYINLNTATAQCQYCGQKFKKETADSVQKTTA